MPRLNNEERARALAMLECGLSENEVANRFNCSRSTVTRLVQRVRVTGTLADRPRSGAPRVTTRRQDNFIRQRHLRDRFVTAESTTNLVVGNRGVPVSRYTIRRRLLEQGIRCRRPYRGVILNRRHRQQRLLWARQHLQDRWNSVVFSDESRFNLFNADGRVRVYRRRNERYVNNCVYEINRYGGGGIMVWGAINHGFKSDLVVCQGNITARRYIDQVLAPVIIPMFNQRHGLTLQHDNARPHVARITQDYLQHNNVNVLPWPSCSPDCNPIEHVWDYIGQRLRKRQQQPRTVQQLTAAVREEWNRIPRYMLRNWCGSMRRRLTAVIASGGGHTRY